MRVLVDEKRLPWDEAWEHHRGDVRLHEPHAARRGARAWPVALFERLLPRHLRDHLRDQPALPARRCMIALPVRRRAAARACRSSRRARRSRCAWRTSRSSGSHAVNGVAALHTELLKRDVLRDFAEMFPRGSTTRPTASRRAAGCCSATRGSRALITERDRRRAGSRTSTSCASSSRSRTTPRSRGVPRR